MELQGAIIFMPRDESGTSLLLEDVLFDPAALWLCEALKQEGVGRFLVVCADEDKPAAAVCFPHNTVFVTTDAADAPARLADFLAQAPGSVAVVTRPVLLCPQGTSFQSEGRKKPAPSAYTLRGAALAAALKDGKDFDDALSALGQTQEWEGRCLPLERDAARRALVIEPMARNLGVDRLLRDGVRIVDTESVFVGPAVSVGAGSVLLPGTILRGATAIGERCVLGPNAMIRDCRLGAGVTVNASQLNESTVDDGTTVGPFAYIRPNCHVGRDVKVGDFVELKNSTVGDGTKISHLTYVGDTDAGAHINFGCGTVTVNYDGTKKFRTTIGDGAFIGCNSNLVAPVVIGEGAYTAAGSTITDDVPAEALAIARDRQVVKKQWAAKRRNKR